MGLIVDQSTSNSDRPFSVEVETSNIEGVALSSGFVNDNGSLKLRDVNVLDTSMAGALISVNGDRAELLLDNIIVTQSSIQVRSLLADQHSLTKLVVVCSLMV